MKKIFISQPMKGKSEEDIKKERNHLIKKVKENYGDDIEIIDFYFDDFDTEKWSPLRYLSESIKLLSEADIAVFAKDWESARGCKIEHECAIEYGIEVIESYSY